MRFKPAGHALAVATAAVLLPLTLYVFAARSGSQWSARPASLPVLELRVSGHDLAISVRNRGAIPGRITRIAGLLNDGTCAQSDHGSAEDWQLEKGKLEAMIDAVMASAAFDRSRMSADDSMTLNIALPDIGSALPAGAQVVFVQAGKDAASGGINPARFIEAAFEIPINIEMCELGGSNCTRLMHSFTCDWPNARKSREP